MLFIILITSGVRGTENFFFISSVSSDFLTNNSKDIWTIRNSSNLKERYAVLKKIYQNDLVTDAIAWWRNWKLEIARKQKSLKKQATKLNSLILAEENKQSWWDINTIAELKQQKIDLIKEANSIDGLEWEIFAWVKWTVFDAWELDKLDNSDPSNPSEAIKES